MKTNTKEETSTKPNQRNHGTHFTHSTHFLKRANAFTLAEVLITLAIIGVVAAITVPSLIQGYKKKEYSTKLQKFYSTMQQAIEMSTVHNGAVEYWNKKEYININELEDEDEIEQARLTNAKDGFEFVNTYILPYMKYLKIEENQPIEINNGTIVKLTKVYLNDGSTFFVNNGDCIDFFYDVNGDEGPDKEGYDRYRFLFSPLVSSRKTYFETNKQYFGTYGYQPSRYENYHEHIYDLCAQNGKYCSDLLRMDNWEYKDNYPYKI